MVVFLLICILLVLLFGAAAFKNAVLAILAIVVGIGALVYFFQDNLTTAMVIGFFGFIALAAFIRVVFPDEWEASEIENKKEQVRMKHPDDIGVAYEAEAYSTDRLLDARRRLLQAGMPPEAIEIVTLDRIIAERTNGE